MKPFLIFFAGLIAFALVALIMTGCTLDGQATIQTKYGTVGITPARPTEGFAK